MLLRIQICILPPSQYQSTYVFVCYPEGLIGMLHLLAGAGDVGKDVEGEATCHEVHDFEDEPILTEGDVEVDKRLLSVLDIEVSTWTTSQKRGASPTSRSTHSCPFCPFRAFSSMLRLPIHVTKHHQRAT